MNKVVIYQSGTGFTAKYAGWIAEELGCEAVELKKAKKLNFQDYDVVVYGGWIMANMVHGYNKIKALKLNKVVVFGVGMSVPNDELVAKMAEQNQVPIDDFFYYEGGYNPKKVGAFKKMMMNIIKKSIEKKPEKTQADLHMLETFKGADNTNKEFIKPLLDYIGRM